MTNHDLYRRLKNEIDKIQVVDTHEHLFLPEEDYLKMKADFAQFLFQYNIDDLVSSGMEVPCLQEFPDTTGYVLRVNGKALDEKWTYIKP